MGYSILGDSANAIDSFLLPPYDSPNPRTSEDYFTFYHSSAKITVEYTLGEIDLMWGIFWKHFACSLKKGSVIIESAMRLHNFLVDYKGEDSESDLVENEGSIFNEDVTNSSELPMVVGNYGSMKKDLVILTKMCGIMV